MINIKLYVMENMETWVKKKWKQ